MLRVISIRQVLSLFSALLGGSGVFCALYSFEVPGMAVHALALLGTALTLSFYTARP
jgi:hypothetical protein